MLSDHYNLQLIQYFFLLQWVPRESAAPISHATFSCDSQLIYAGFLDATVCVLTAGHLHMQCRIIPSAYLSPNMRYFLLPANLFIALILRYFAIHY